MCAVALDFRALGVTVLALACSQRFEFDVSNTSGGSKSTDTSAGGSNADGTAPGGSGDSTRQTGSARGGSDDGNGDREYVTAGSGGRNGTAGAVGSTGGASTPACPVNCGTFGLKCASDWHSCVECNADIDCTKARPYCGTTAALAHRCLECNGATCPWGSSCDPTSGRCIRACHVEDDGEVDDHFCQNGTTCSSATGFCAECETDANCVGNPHGSFCHSTSRQCVGCTGDVQCSAAARNCDPTLSICVACRDGRDCPSGVCDATTRQCR